MARAESSSLEKKPPIRCLEVFYFHHRLELDELFQGRDYVFVLSMSFSQPVHNHVLRSEERKRSVLFVSTI
jgi:hypothetical protein